MKSEHDSIKKSQSRGLIFLPLIIVVWLSTPFVVFPAGAEDKDGRTYLQEGRKALESGSYADAVERLSKAEEAFPLLGDYAAFYLAEAYRNLQDHDKALSTLRSMLRKYPDSPLRRRARAAEIRETAGNEAKDILQLYEAYVKDYPEDDDMAYAFGLFLRQKGKDAKAAQVFRDIYLRAGALSKSALAELNGPDISADDLMQHALNLMKRYEFREAERDLRKALEKSEPKRRDEIMKNLGLSLFRQKDYSAAAVVYDKANDLYSKARSLYRAGDKEGFEAALQDLSAKNDKKAGPLFIAAAADKRREKKFDEALKIYNEALLKYPAEAEEAMWGMGWTYYKSAEYGKASGIFSKLYDKTGDNKYLYWKARSMEESGEDAGRFYSSLLRSNNCFYSALTYAKNRGKSDIRAFPGVSVSIPSSDPQRRIERTDALLSLGMIREAVTELICLSKKVEKSSDMMYVISRLQELGEFKRAIGLAVKMPYSENVHGFWYPMAYWDDVEKISGKFGVDPFLALAVMREESRFDADAKSVAGARGLMQLMPRTAFHLDRSIKLGIKREAQINDVRNNINLGTYYLKSLFEEFKSMARVLAAYNAGEINARKWEQRDEYKSDDEFIEDIPFVETRNYVKKVMTSYFEYKKASVAGDAAYDFSMLLPPVR